MIGTVCVTVGLPVKVRGYAQDFGAPIVGVQFSCDGGATWTSYDIEGANSDRNVNWSFSFVLPEEGIYELRVRAKCSDGRLTPEPARVRVEARAG